MWIQHNGKKLKWLLLYDLELYKYISYRFQVIDTVYDVQQGAQGLVPALENFCEQVKLTFIIH